MSRIFSDHEIQLSGGPDLKKDSILFWVAPVPRTWGPGIATDLNCRKQITTVPTRPRKRPMCRPTHRRVFRTNGSPAKNLHVFCR
jgi:hypothetical protein